MHENYVRRVPILRDLLYCSYTTIYNKSTGTTNLMFCITTDEVTACASGMQVFAGGSTTVSASDLGDPADMYLNVTNLSPDTDVSYRVTIV